MTLSICPFVRTSDQTCSCTKIPSYCTRQARATLDTVSPVESDTRWTWKLRLATTQLTPQHPKEKRGIGDGRTRTVVAFDARTWIWSPTRPAGPSNRPFRIVRDACPW